MKICFICIFCGALLFSLHIALIIERMDIILSLGVGAQLMEVECVMASNSNDDFEKQNSRIRERMDKIGRKIMILSGKGGVGKTTVTVNLANALVDMGCTVGVLDVDIHGPNVAKMFGVEGAELGSPDGVTMIPIEPRKGLKVMSLSFALDDPSSPIIWRGSMKMSAIRQFLSDVDWGTLDYLLIDTPPGTGDEQLTVIQAIPELTGAIIVTTPQDVAVLDSRRSVEFARKCGVAIIGVVENMSGLKCPHCGEEIPIFGKGGGEKMCSQMHVPFLGSVPMEIDLCKAEDEGKDWIDEPGAHPSATALKEIANQINNGTTCSTSRDTSYLGTSFCTPSACASCSSKCSSRKG